MHSPGVVAHITLPGEVSPAPVLVVRNLLRHDGDGLLVLGSGQVGRSRKDPHVLILHCAAEQVRARVHHRVAGVVRVQHVVVGGAGHVGRASEADGALSVVRVTASSTLGLEGKEPHGPIISPVDDRDLGADGIGRTISGRDTAGAPLERNGHIALILVPEAGVLSNIESRDVVGLCAGAEGDTSLSWVNERGSQGGEHSSSHIKSSQKL